MLADQHGQVVVLGTRDCSLQRRNQKLVEEAPAPFLTDAQRTSIHRAAQAICAAAGYVSAGTVEFLLSRTGQISFLEVNTRLQVEHPVTEETTDVDLVVEQLRIADGLPLSLTETPVPRGHSIEFRINAEDPGRGYLPTPGRIEHFAAPSGPGVRLDSGVAAGSVIPGSFDSLMAKLIVTGATREQALQRARRALAEFQIEGVASVLPFHRAVVQDPAFTAEQGFGVHTRWIETEMQQHWLPAPRPDAVAETPLQRCYMEIDGKRVRLGLPALLLPGLSAAGGVAAPVAGQLASAGALQPGEVAAPMAGSLVAWKVDDGAQVAEGAVLALMEAMKMETAITATSSGTLQQVATAGALLQAGQVVARITTG